MALDLLLTDVFSLSRLDGGLFGGPFPLAKPPFLPFTAFLVSFFLFSGLDADAELLLRFAPCDLEDSESELDEFESDPLELPLDDDEPELEQLDPVVLTD